MVVRHWTLVIVLCIGLLGIYSFDKTYCDQEAEHQGLDFARFSDQLELMLQSETDRLMYEKEQTHGKVIDDIAANKMLEEAFIKVKQELAHNADNFYFEILTENGELLHKSNQLAMQSPVRQKILQVDDKRWIIKTGWSQMPKPDFFMRTYIWGLGGSALILLLAFLYNLFRRQEWLVQAVTDKTKELLLKNNQLELEISEHEDAEHALRVSKQRLDALLCAVPDILLRVNREGVLLDMEAKNPADFFLPRAELLHKKLADLLPVDVYEKFEEINKKIVANGEVLTTEYQLRINGVKKDFEARVALLTNNEIVIIARDVTEENQDEACERILMQTAAKVLQEASTSTILSYVCEQLVAVFEVSLVRVILKADDDTVKISAAAGKLALETGNSSLNTIATGPLSSLAIKTGSLQVIQKREKLSPWQEKLLAELQLDNTEIQSEIALPLVIQGHTAGAFYLISTRPNYWDERIITRLQQFSDQLSLAISAARDRQRLALLIAGLEAAANAVVITNKEGNVEWFNPAFTALTGYKENEVRGKNLMILSGYQDARFCQRFWQQLNDEAEAWRGEFAQCRKDGSLYEEVMTITPVRNRHKQITNFIAIKEDITEQKMVASAIAKANEVRVQAEKLSSLGTMAAGLSHEINQPLNSIKMIASGMVYAYHNGKQRPVEEIIRNVEEISNQTDRINNIIMHMRSFIHRDESQATCCQINAAIEQSLKIIGSQLVSHGVQIEKDLADNLPFVYAMPTALEELVINLAANAMQAMDMAECQDKKLVIQTWTGKNNVYIKFADSGPGIKGAHRDKIFEPFFSTKPGKDNLGLGLSIVQSIVTSCGGTISIVSKESEGAAFLITFPGITEEAV